MFAKFIWFLVKVNFKLSVLLLVALLVGGAAYHLEFVHVWANNTPMLALVDPNTGVTSSSVQPLKALLVIGQLLLDGLVGLVGRYV